MRTYIIRFNHPKYGSISAQTVAATEFDARAEIEDRFPGCEITSSFIKPGKA